jgi:transforming growth factor-beta-induced protein
MKIQDGILRSVRSLGSSLLPLPWRRRPARYLRVTLLPALLLAVAACGEDDPMTPVINDDIVDIVVSTADVSTLEAALQSAGLVSALQGDGPFTVFAPRNEAFDALGADVVAALLEEGNADLLSKVLTFHVMAGVAARSTDLTDGQTVTTLQGADLTIGVAGGTVTVNGATVVSADIEATNGVIHLIDAVLVPPVDVVERAILTSETQTLVAALDAGDLLGILGGAGPFTVFAPVDAAFEALGSDKLDVLLDPANLGLLQKILTYHVISDDVRAADLTDGLSVETVEGSEITFDLSGATPKVNGAEIIATDIIVENGVIHLIDGVLAENADLVDVALLNGFPTLVDLVVGAGLETTLRDDNGGAGFTVFAPTEEAFAALGSVPSGEALVDVLTYHVVSGTVGSGALSDGQVVTTVQGETFTVNIDGSDVTITDQGGNTVNVLVTDVPAANGVVHVIDGVVLPS